MSYSVDHYVVAGIDLQAFVAAWVGSVESGGGRLRGFRGPAGTDPDVHERYSSGAAHLMGEIGSRAAEPNACAEELLLFAVLALYRHAGFPGADQARWDGAAGHVRGAFAHLAELGDREAGRRLRSEVLRRSVSDRPAEVETLLQRSVDHDPGRTAALEQLMASTESRSFRAATLLDPAGGHDIEAEVLALFDGGYRVS